MSRINDYLVGALCALTAVLVIVVVILTIRLLAAHGYTLADMLAATGLI